MQSRFATTHWSIVQAARVDSATQARTALSTLCEQYWFPIYAHVRRRISDPGQAEDLTQDFFARIVETKLVADADPKKGRFRTFLLTALHRYLTNELNRDSAAKRGGRVRSLSIDLRDAENRLMLEPLDAMTPESEFERRWALTTLERVYVLLREEYVSSDRHSVFETLKPFLPGRASPVRYRDLATELKMPESAVKVAIHRLRKRFGTLLRREIGQTVTSPDEVDDEIRRLQSALSG